MSPKLKINLVKYGITSLVSLLITFCYYQAYKNSDMGIYRVLSDGFFIPGVLITGFGLLFIVSNEGIFDGLTYGLQLAFKSLIPGGRLKKPKSYAVYKAEKEEKRVKGFSFIIVVGVIDLVLALSFTIMYHM